MKKIYRILAACLFAIVATASNKPETFMMQKQQKFHWDRCFKDVMLALNIGLACFWFFRIFLEMPIIICIIEIGFIAVLCSLVTKPWTEEK